MKIDREESLRALKVGDTVVLRDLNFPARRVKVEKIGRTLLHVRGHLRGGAAAFDLKTGRNKDGMSWVMTVEESDRETRIDEARKSLRDFGVDVRDTEKVLAVYEALKPLMG